MTTSKMMSAENEPTAENLVSIGDLAVAAAIIILMRCWMQGETIGAQWRDVQGEMMTSKKTTFQVRAEKHFARAGVKSWNHLGVVANVPTQTIFDYMHGRVMPGVIPALRIARVLDTTVEELWG
jgi:hypothetical protein